MCELWQSFFCIIQFQYIQYRYACSFRSKRKKNATYDPFLFLFCFFLFVTFVAVANHGRIELALQLRMCAQYHIHFTMLQCTLKTTICYCCGWLVGAVVGATMAADGNYIYKSHGVQYQCLIFYILNGRSGVRELKRSHTHTHRHRHTDTIIIAQHKIQ